MAKGNGGQSRIMAPGGASPAQARSADWSSRLQELGSRLKSLSPAPANPNTPSGSFSNAAQKMSSAVVNNSEIKDDGSKNLLYNPVVGEGGQTLMDRVKAAQSSLDPMLSSFRETMEKGNNDLNTRLQSLMGNLNQLKQQPSAVGGYAPSAPPPTSISPLPTVAAQPPAERAIKGFTPFASSVNATKQQAADYFTQQLKQRGAPVPDQNLWNQLIDVGGYKEGQAVTGDQGNKMMRFLADKYNWY